MYEQDDLYRQTPQRSPDRLMMFRIELAPDTHGRFVIDERGRRQYIHGSAGMIGQDGPGERRLRPRCWPASVAVGNCIESFQPPVRAILVSAIQVDVPRARTHRRFRKAGPRSLVELPDRQSRTLDTIE